MSSAKRLAREILDTRRLALGHATSPQLTSSAIDGGGIDITDGDGNRIGGLGLGDDGGFKIDYTGGPKPPKPSPPTVTADAGIFRIEWDGSFVNEGDEGVLATSDTDRVEIHASMDENFVPDRVESFGGAFATLDGGSFALGPLPEAGTYYFRLVARSKSAQFSEPSDRVEQELAITSIDLEITDAWLTGEAAQNTADGKNSIWRGPDEPEVDPDRPFKDGDIWFEMTDDGKSIPNIWDETAGAWVANDDKRQSDIERVQQELREELDTIVVDGSGTKNFYTPDMPTEGMREGDLWFDSSDSNKPYIYQDGEWITVRDSFSPPGAGENVFALLGEAGTTKNAIDNQWASVPGFTFTPGASGVEAEVPAGAAAGTATVRLPLTGTFNSAGEWQITAEDTIQSNSLGLGGTGSFRFYSPGADPTARIVLGVDVPGMDMLETVQPLVIKEDKIGSTRTHSMNLEDQNLQIIGIYPSVYAWSLFLEVTVDSVPGNTVSGSGQLAYAVGGKGIVDKAITTEKIAAGAITAESGIIGSINAGTITVGEMDGARIKAQSIYSDKLLIGGDRNLIPNGELDKGSSIGWPSDAEYQTTDVPAGMAAAVTFPAGRGSVSSWRDIGSFPIQPGDTLAYEVWVKADTAGSTLFMEVRDQSGAHLSTASGNAWVNLEGGSTHASYPIGNWTVPTEWTKVVSTLKVGGSATSFYLGTWFLNHSAGTNRNAKVSFAGLKVYKQVGATLIQDGAISTEHIRAGAITAESGIIGSLDANVITVGKIMGNQLDADAINGKTITGATIRTASSGSRVELTQNGLKQYNSLGATIVDMTAGSFALQGGSITGSTIKTATSGSRVEINTQGLRQYNSSNEVIAEMVGGSMVMTGVLEQENSIAKMQVGPVWGGSTTTSPGIHWDNITGHPNGAAMGVVTDGTDSAIALQGPSKTSSANGALLNLFDDRVYMNVGSSAHRLDIKPGDSILRVETSSDRYAYLSMESAAGKGTHLNRRTSTNGGSWLSMYDDRSVLTWHGSDADQSTYLNMRANAYDLRAYGASGDLVSGLWADTTATTLSAFKRPLELYGHQMQMMRTAVSGGETLIISPMISQKSYSGSANLHISGGGGVGKIGSSLRYKTDVLDARDATPNILDVQPRTWIDKGEAKQWEEAQAKQREIGIGPLPAEYLDAHEPVRHFGAIAEEVDELGLESLVIYDEFGRPESLAYDRFAIALIPAIRGLRDRLEELEAQLASA